MSKDDHIKPPHVVLIVVAVDDVSLKERLADFEGVLLTDSTTHSEAVLHTRNLEDAAALVAGFPDVSMTVEAFGRSKERQLVGPAWMKDGRWRAGLNHRRASTCWKPSLLSLDLLGKSTESKPNPVLNEGERLALTLP
ncbi:hypothetical protein Bbelb_188460 [Branchiostoma belcheri]|nr:hypothetical protein Bbelb_188460 [Branchiostoma belcheri]